MGGSLGQCLSSCLRWVGESRVQKGPRGFWGGKVGAREEGERCRRCTVQGGQEGMTPGANSPGNKAQLCGVPEACPSTGAAECGCCELWPPSSARW